MNKEAIGYYASLSVLIITLSLILTVLVKQVFPVVAPFLIGWLVALSVEPLAERLTKNRRIPKPPVRLILSLFISFALFTLVGILIWQSASFVVSFITELLEGDRLGEMLGALNSPSHIIFGDSYPDGLSESIAESVRSMLREVAARIASALASLAGNIPRVLLFLLVTLISLVYFSIDLDRIGKAVLRILPRSISKSLQGLKEKVFLTARRYVGSYLIIMMMTYGLMLAGLLLLGVRKAPLIALIIALLDILPVLGVGTVLLPWGVISIALGDHFLGIGLIVLFVVNTVVRQLAEPRIVGKSLGMHPIAALAMIYVGYSLFGGAGLIAFPLFAVILGALFKKDEPAAVE